MYVTIRDLNMLFDDGELYRLFFRWRSSEAKLIRGRRIQLLTRLNQLTEANSSMTSLVFSAPSVDYLPRTHHWHRWLLHSRCRDHASAVSVAVHPRSLSIRCPASGHGHDRNHSDHLPDPAIIVASAGMTTRVSAH
jgi:hypothetical protein